MRWRLIDLCRLVEERFGVSYKGPGMSKLLKQLGFSHISGRPQHPAQDPQVIDALPKNFPNTLAAHIADLPPDTPVEIWFQE